MRVAVLGAGSWGTAIAILLGRGGHEVLLMGRDASELELLRSTRENSRYLRGFALPDSVEIASLGTAAEADIAVVAVPSYGFVDALRTSKVVASVLVVATKGLEPETGRLLCEVAAEVVGGRMAVLSGPNLAVEIARGIPTVAVVASEDPAANVLVRDTFSGPTFRVSLSEDVVGVEVAGALKNVLAIGAGMSDGLGFGDNTKGALLSRGLIEMARLGLAMGAKMETFLGPAGVGDLFATANSTLSRNYRCGRSLGEGATLEAALDALGQVAEGVPTAHSVLRLAVRHAVDMPVFGAVDAVIQGRIPPKQAVALLMDRSSSMQSFIGS